MELKSVLAKLDSETAETPFGPYQEEAIISLALDFPEFFASAGRFMTAQLFARPETQYIMAHLLGSFEKFGVVPTRKLFRDQITKDLTTDHPYEAVLAIVDRKSDPREVPIVKDTLIKWAKSRAFGLLYSDEAHAAYYRGDYTALEEIVNQANRIADVGDKGLWFFEQLELLFEEQIIEHRTTGFSQLDIKLNNGGPSPGEVLVWMSATNVGKSLLMCNNAITSLKGFNTEGDTGQDVLLVTFEMDVIKTAFRCLGACTGVNIDSFREHKDFIRQRIQQISTSYKKKLYIYELPPEECSVSHIYALIDNLKRMKGWKPDVLILDYLDLMMSRVQAYNDNDYSRQKHVATEIRGLAKNENLLVFTATQTNRSGSGSDELIDLDKAAESYGKTMPLDYIVTLNQSDAERLAPIPQMRMYIAKNRNGPKHEIVRCSINYNNMKVEQIT